MPMPRYAARKDGNHNELVQVALQMRALWLPQGPFDGWVWHPTRAGWYPVEIKLPEREGLKQEYTPLQQRLMREWQGKGAKWLVWRTQQDVVESLGGRY